MCFGLGSRRHGYGGGGGVCARPVVVYHPHGGGAMGMPGGHCHGGGRHGMPMGMGGGGMMGGGGLMGGGRRMGGGWGRRRRC